MKLFTPQYRRQATARYQSEDAKAEAIREGRKYTPWPLEPWILKRFQERGYSLK